eukprot:1403255-Prymnesium_polylepis.1
MRERGVRGVLEPRRLHDVLGAGTGRPRALRFKVEGSRDAEGQLVGSARLHDVLGQVLDGHVVSDFLELGRASLGVDRDQACHIRVGGILG